MAEAKITVSLDDESKELIRALVKAVNRIAQAQGVIIDDASFADVRIPQFPVPKRLLED